jgi:hypothetical protein
MSEFSSCATNSITGNGSMKAVADISEKAQRVKSKLRRYVCSVWVVNHLLRSKTMQ